MFGRPLVRVGKVALFCWASELSEDEIRDASYCSHGVTMALVSGANAVADFQLWRTPVNWPLIVRQVVSGHAAL